MEEWLVDGRSLCEGTVEVAGFKHALVSVVAACVACRGGLVLTNAPDILDTRILARLLTELGAQASFDGRELTLDCRELAGGRVTPELSEQIHGSLYLIPAVLTAGRPLAFHRSGGCAIGDGAGGARPVSHMLSVLREFGASFDFTPDGWLRAHAPVWRAARIDIGDYSDSPHILTGPLVSGASKTALIAALGVKEGEAVVLNAYPKPDVTDLLRFAAAKGRPAKLRGGELRLRAPQEQAAAALTRLRLTPDLSEIMTFLTLGVMSNTPIEVFAEDMELARVGLKQECLLLEEMGISLDWSSNRVRASAPPRLRTVDIEVTSVGIYSDHQPFFALLLTRGDRPATIRERVWRRRFDYIDLLQEFGVRVERGEGFVTIFPSALVPPSGRLIATDLRMAAVLLVAALCVRRPCRLAGLEHLRRGYGQLCGQLTRLGAEVRDLSPTG